MPKDSSMVYAAICRYCGSDLPRVVQYRDAYCDNACRSAYKAPNKKRPVKGRRSKAWEQLRLEGLE